MEKVTLFSSAIWYYPVGSLFPIPSALGKAVPWWEAAAPLPGHCCESEHGGHQQSLSAQDWDSRGGVHPLGSRTLSQPHGLNRNSAIPCVTLSSCWPSWLTWRSCVCPLLVSLMQGGLVAAHWGHSPQVTGPICQHLLHSWEFLFQLSLFCGPMILWICLVAHSTDNGGFLPCPLICDITKYLLCFNTKGEGISACFPKIILAILFKP